MKKSWPAIRKTTNHGKPAFLVDARIDGRGERRFFPTKAEAEGFAQVCRIRRKNEGQSALVDDELASYGWTVAQAVKFTVEHLRKTRASIKVRDAIAGLVESKEAANNSDRYCRWMRQRLERLVPVHGDKPIASLHAADLEVFLNGLRVSPTTRNTYRRDLVTLWSWAIKNRYAEENEAQKVDTARTVDAPPAIFTVDQAAALLAASRDDVLAFHAIGLFAGLRVAELLRLSWEQVDFNSGFIEVGAAQSKTRSRRLVPILNNLREWLLPVAKTGGRIILPNFQKRQLATRAAAGVTEWPENGLRHSFVSYRLAATGDAAKTALEAGHDQAVLFRHYRELVRPSEAERYFNILPSGAGKIIPMNAVA